MTYHDVGITRRVIRAGIGIATASSLVLGVLSPATAFAAEDESAAAEPIAIEEVAPEATPTDDEAVSDQEASAAEADDVTSSEAAPEAETDGASSDEQTPVTPEPETETTPAETEPDAGDAPSAEGTETPEVTEGAQAAENTQAVTPATEDASTDSDTTSEDGADEATAAKDAAADRVNKATAAKAPSASGTLAPRTTNTANQTTGALNGFHKFSDGVLRYYVNGTLLKNGHVVYKGRLYIIDANGVATNVTSRLKRSGYYRCPDGYIFFANKNSGSIIKNSKGWHTSSTWGRSKGGRYYLRIEADGGFSYARYGFDTGGYAHFTTKKGYVRTINYKKGNKLYLINNVGKILTLSKNDVAVSGTKDQGFKWAKGYGDKTSPETINNRELYYLQRETSGAWAGAYYVEYDKKGVFSTKGTGLRYTTKTGAISTYNAPHYVTSFGFILRAVDDAGHNIRIKGKMPVIYKKQVYLADDNGQLKKGAKWSSNQKKAINVIKRYKSKTHYAITVSKSTHRVYLWYRANLKSRKWLPLFETRCTIGNEHVSWTPTGVTQTYDHIKYFANCTYYATGYRTSREGGWHLHATLYNLANGRRTDSRLGYNVSNGCIRVNINYARYIYRNVPLRTRFIVY